MGQYEERDRARQAVLLRASFGENIPAEFPAPLKLARCKDGENPSAWASKAGDVFADRAQAAYSDWMETPEYRSYWAARGAASAIVKAQAIKASDYAEPVLFSDRYYDSIDELLADLADDEEELPVWVWATEPSGFHFDIQDAVGNYLADSHHEDAEVDHMDELIVFWKQWAEKQSLRTYWESHKRLVVIDEAAFAEVLTAARATLELPPAVESPYSVKPVALATTTPPDSTPVTTAQSPADAGRMSATKEQP